MSSMRSKERSGNGVKVIGRGDEHDLGQVILQLQVVIPERVVLFGIQHFQGARPPDKPRKS